jgi:hypothetical protein
VLKDENTFISALIKVIREAPDVNEKYINKHLDEAKATGN